MLPRGIVIIAVLAALFGAPSTASAAANALKTPLVSPAIGTTTTTFTLGVTYEGQHAAQRIDALVAGIALPMARVSGTSAAGTWQVSTTLPTGSWPVTFTATTERGNSPVLVGGTVVVDDVAAPSSPAAPTPRRGEPAPTPESVDPITPWPTPPPADPAPAGTPATAAGPSGDAFADPTTKSGPIAAKPTAGGGDTGDEPAQAPAAEGHDGAAPSAPDPSTHAVATPTTRPRPSGETRGNGAAVEMAATTDGEPAMTEDAVNDALGILAMWGILLGAVGAVMLLVVLRRRRGTPEPATLSLAEETAALLERRALRQARTVIPDDPIVTSLGIDDTELARRRSDRRRRRRPPTERPD